MTITLNQFMGTLPRLDPRRLPPGHATEAHNARLLDGTLRPYRSPALVHTFSVPRQTFVFANGLWEGFSGIVSVVPGPVASDRLYYAGEPDGPKVRQGTTLDKLGVPAPTTRLTAERLGTAPTVPPALETIGYVVTFLTVRDEEGPPSGLSNTFLGHATTSASLTNFPAAPAGHGIDRYRVYRTVTDTLGVTSLFFVKELPINTVSWTHNPATDPVNEEITSINHDMPPITLQGLCAMQNGIIAGWSGKDLLFCEPYKPHAWPEAYRLKTDYPIVGLAAFGTMLAVLTTGTPYRVQGTQPDRMQMEQIEQIAPCLSTEGIVDMGYAAIYPSTEGLMQITAEGAQIISNAAFDRETWDSLNPSTFTAARFEDGYLYAWTPTGQPRRSGLFTLGVDPVHHASLDGNTVNLWQRIENGRTYAIDPAAAVTMFNAPEGAPMVYRWRSGVFKAPAPVNYGAFMVDSTPEKGQTAQPTTVRVYADGALVATRAAMNETAYRLPAGFRAREWQFELEGTQRVTRVRIAPTIQDLLTTP